MLFEGVSFSEEKVRLMTEDSFVDEVAAVFWKDRAKADRRKLARQAYRLISPSSPRGEK